MSAAAPRDSFAGFVAERAAWPLDPAITYLNHGGYGVTPKAVLAAQEEWRAESERNPTGFMTRTLPGALRDAAGEAIDNFRNAFPPQRVPVPQPAEREDLSRVMGFFTDTTLCIGCKACEVACKQWNQLPADGMKFTGNSYDNTQHLGATTWRHAAMWWS